MLSCFETQLPTGGKRMVATALKGMAHILFASAPLKVRNPVVCLGVVLVVYLLAILWWADEHTRNDAMNEELFLFTGQSQPNSEVALMVKMGAEDCPAAIANATIR
jgi:hypothetical protein